MGQNKNGDRVLFHANTAVTATLLAVGSIGGFFLAPVIFLAGAVLAIPALLLYGVWRVAMGILRNDGRLKEKRIVPVVLIVEDDVDSAEAVRAVFKNCGCRVVMATHLETAHKKIAYQGFDLVVLDWILGEKTDGGMIVERAVKIIDRVFELKDRFTRHPLKVITYSSLGSDGVQLPTSSYFDHREHWTKPANYFQLQERTRQYLNTVYH